MEDEEGLEVMTHDECAHGGSGSGAQRQMC